MSSESKRSYQSEKRKSQAADTKQRIFAAATELFQAHGFEKVTIGQLAAAAKVSPSTIYSLFESKRGVVQAMMDEALPPDRFTSLVEKWFAETEPLERLKLTAKMTREMYDAERAQMELFRGAAVLSPELKELEQEREQRRYDRQKDSVELLHSEKVLHPHLTLTQARDIFWSFTGRDLYRLFVIERGWTPDAYENWLADTLVRALLR